MKRCNSAQPWVAVLSARTGRKTRCKKRHNERRSCKVLPPSGVTQNKKVAPLTNNILCWLGWGPTQHQPNAHIKRLNRLMSSVVWKRLWCAPISKCTDKWETPYIRGFATMRKRPCLMEPWYTAFECGLTHYFGTVWWTDGECVESSICITDPSCCIDVIFDRY